MGRKKTSALEPPIIIPNSISVLVDLFFGPEAGRGAVAGAAHSSVVKGHKVDI